MPPSYWRRPASHEFRLDDLAFWLREYGFEPNEVAEVEILIGESRTSGGFGAQARVHFFLTNEHGARFLAGDDAAMGHQTINIRSLPPLREIS